MKIKKVFVYDDLLDIPLSRFDFFRDNKDNSTFQMAICRDAIQQYCNDTNQLITTIMQVEVSTTNPKGLNWRLAKYIDSEIGQLAKIIFCNKEFETLLNHRNFFKKHNISKAWIKMTPLPSI